MSQVYFGATRSDVTPHYEAFSVPIRRIKCSKCPTKYVIWGNENAPDRDREEAVILLTQFVEKDHPTHKPVLYGAATLDELRKRVGRKATAAELSLP